MENVWTMGMRHGQEKGHGAPCPYDDGFPYFSTIIEIDTTMIRFFKGGITQMVKKNKNIIFVFDSVIIKNIL